MSRSDPGVKNPQLVFGRIHENDAHSDSFVDVDHFGVSDERLSITGNYKFKRTIQGKGAWSVHVATLAADFGHSSHNTGCTPRFEELGNGKDGITRYSALNAVSCVQSCFQIREFRLCSLAAACLI